jgi:hypothetical protein
MDELFTFTCNLSSVKLKILDVVEEEQQDQQEEQQEE